MTGFPNRKTIELLREQFKPGITVELTAAMEDPYEELSIRVRFMLPGKQEAPLESRSRRITA